jgi:hypothetical protein
MKAFIADVHTTARPGRPRTLQIIIQVTGLVDYAILNYGDGTEERADIPLDEPHPRLMADHTYAPGRYRMTISIWHNNVQQERRVVAVSVS